MRESLRDRLEALWNIVMPIQSFIEVKTLLLSLLYSLNMSEIRFEVELEVEALVRSLGEGEVGGS